MAFDAKVFSIMIASPGDVDLERKIIGETIHDWNDLNSRSADRVALPVGWETHSTPVLGGRAQGIINERILDGCDLLIGVFWTKLGTPTGQAESGTAEEIRRHHEAGKPAMVYFSTAPVQPETFDKTQWDAKEGFKGWCQENGLTETYDSIGDFSLKLGRQLQRTLRDDPYLSNLAGGDVALNDTPTPSEPRQVQLSHEASRLLKEASRDRSGVVMTLRHLNGTYVQTNGINFTADGDRRTIARWEAAIQQLVDNSFLTGRGQKGEMFEVTAAGFEMADTLPDLD